MPQRDPHIHFNFARNSLKENAHGAQFAIHSRPECRYKRCRAKNPDRHTIPNVILLSCGNIVKHNCAKFGAGLRKSLVQVTKGEIGY